MMDIEKQSFWNSLEPWRQKQITKGIALVVATASFSMGIESRDESVDGTTRVPQAKVHNVDTGELPTPKLRVPLMVQPEGVGNRTPSGIAHRLDAYQ